MGIVPIPKILSVRKFKFVLGVNTNAHPKLPMKFNSNLDGGFLQALSK